MAIVAVKSRIQHVSQYITDLRTLTGLYIGWVPEQYASTVDAENFIETIKNDDAVQHALTLLSVKITGENWEVETPNKQLKYILNKALKHIRDFPHVLKSITENAILLGMGVSLKEWDFVKWRIFPGLKWIVPVAIKEVDRRRLRIVYDVEDRNKKYWTLWTIKYDQYIKLVDRADVPDIEHGAAVQDYIWHFDDFNELHPYFRSIGEVLFPLTWLRKNALQYWGELGEKWGKPFLIARINTQKGTIASNIGAGHPTTNLRIEKWKKLLTSAMARHGIVLDMDGDQLDAIYAQSGSQNILEGLLNYCDKRIEKFLLGGDLISSSGGGTSSSYAHSDNQQGNLDALKEYRRSRLEELIVRDLIWDVIIKNRHNLRILNIPYPDKDEVSLKITVKKEEMIKQALRFSWKKNPQMILREV